MKKSSIVAVLCACSLTVACMGVLVGCSTDEASKEASASSIAASVNGAEITEGLIDENIKAYREVNELTDDEAWADYLEEHGYTPESVREDYINDFVTKTLIEEECEKRGITVASHDIDSFVDSMREYYKEHNGIETDEQWEQFLADQGMTEEDYRTNYKYAELTSKLKDDLAAEENSGDEELSTDEINEIYNKWLEEAKDGAEIVIADMPSGFSYDVKLKSEE